MSTAPDVEHATIAELLLTRAEDDNTGVLFEDQRWSWREAVAEAHARARLLLGWRGEHDPGEQQPFHVGVLADNTPEYLFLLLGSALAGATLVGVNPTRRGEELARDIRSTDCQLIVTEQAYAELPSGLDHRAREVLDAGDPAYADRLAQARTDRTEVPTDAALDPTTRLLLLFTSGSTGDPKAVICSTGRWAVICQLNPISFGSEDVAYNAMPLFHGNALMGSFGPCLTRGAAFAMRRRFSASGFAPDIRSFGATFFNYVGRSLAYVLAQPEDPVERENQLRFGFGTEASAHDRAEFQRRFGAPLMESYGSSEGACYIIATSETPDGSLGVPQTGHRPEIVASDDTVCPPARLDADGTLLNPGEAIGEIVSRGAAARFEGYYNNPEATAEKIHGEDFHTGDLGYQDTEGFFWFAGRTADWLRVDSENFAAAPVERILERFPGVAVVAVYPVPDPRTGDQVMAALQLSEPVRDLAELGDRLAAFLAEQPDLGTKWAPSLVRITEELPVTATRKVDKPALRGQRWDTGDPVLVWTGDTYRPLDAEGRQRLRAEFAEHGRSDLLDR